MFQDKQKTREAFLIEWYKILWNNARQSMDGIWKLVGPITLIGTIWLAIYKQYLPSNLGNSLVFIIIFWAINVTIDFNQWHRRNLIFLTAVEREFLFEDDYGKLIPEIFNTPKKEWVGFYKICGYTFCALLILAIIVCIYTFKIQTAWRFCWYERYEFIALLIGIVYTMKNYFGQERSSKKYICELFKEQND